MEEKILNLLRVNGTMPTWVISRKLSMGDKTPKVRAILKKMSLKGLVKRDDWASSKNSIVWKLA